MLKALATLLVFQTIGETASFGLSLPVPGPVIGMALLFGWLLMRPAAADDLRPVTGELLRHLSLLFVPAGVGIMLHRDRFAAEGWAILLAVVVSTVLTLVVTVVTIDKVARRLQPPKSGDRPDAGSDDRPDHRPDAA
jgi:holin-like protein